MYPREMANLALSAASVADNYGFSNTAKALIDLAAQVYLATPIEGRLSEEKRSDARNNSANFYN